MQVSGPSHKRQSDAREAGTDEGQIRQWLGIALLRCKRLRTVRRCLLPLQGHVRWVLHGRAVGLPTLDIVLVLQADSRNPRCGYS